MKIVIGAALFGVLWITAGGAQAQPASRPEFEVASIKLHNGPISMSGLETSGTRVAVDASTVSDMIALAYHLKDYQLAGVVDWMRSERYDVVARSPGDSAPDIDHIRPMLQSLLADRFQLKIHFETHEGPVMAMMLDKPGKLGPKLIPHEQGPPCPDYTSEGLRAPSKAAASASL